MKLEKKSPVANKTMNVLLENNEYDWGTMSLIDFLNEGNIPSSYKDFFIANKEQLELISDELQQVNNTIYPPIQQVFRALYLTPLHKIKAVIIGMDPYHNGSAVGLAFSVKAGNAINPSLRSIYKELKNEEIDVVKDGNLSRWAHNGVLLLNTALTVEKGTPDSHTCLWWQFTKNLISYISEQRKNGIHWILLGKNAHELENTITTKDNIHCTSHPMPLAANRKCGIHPPFFGSNIFRSIPGIDWTII